MSDTNNIKTPASLSNSDTKLVNFGREFEEDLSKMSPFELKNLLLSYAREDHSKSARTLLNAGRGNPNWICTIPRKAFFLLGQFAIAESERSMSQPDFSLAGEPEKQGAGERFLKFLFDHKGEPEGDFLHNALTYLENKGYDPDDVVHEWTEGIIGCEYPVPERILHYTQDIVRDYLVQELCSKNPLPEPMDLFATEGGTAAMCYLFYSLKANFLVNPGDTIALMTPIFTPYIEIPQLNDFHFNVIDIQASTTNSDGLHTWQFPDDELEKLKDKSIKLLCLVNPSNPPSYNMDDECRKKLVEIVKKDNPELIIITDDVYGTFVEGYRSIFDDLPYNTASVYSFSKYFGATGWRLAAIAVAHTNIFDDLIKKLDDDKKAILNARYSSLTDDPASVAFIDRMVADSRLVALNGTAGLSTPQQVQMSLFALYALLDKMNIYKAKMQELIKDRFDYLWKSLGFEFVDDPNRAGYYSIIDLEIWSKKLYGEDFFKWLDATYLPLDIVIRLAKDTGVIVLNGFGFDASRWSIRVSLANLNITDFVEVGNYITKMLNAYYDEYKNEQS